MAVDLHIHSTASDGTQAPDEIVEEARGLGLTAIAIADHDELSGSEAACRHGGVSVRKAAFLGNGIAADPEPVASAIPLTYVSNDA